MNRLILSAIVLSSACYSGFVFSQGDAPKVLAHDSFIAPECEERDHYADGYVEYYDLWCDGKNIATIIYVDETFTIIDGEYHQLEEAYTAIDLYESDEGYRSIVNSDHKWIVWKE